ncbi:phage integrase SAM-like domain-containing protein, partial [Bacteroides sp. CAG:633]|uniref:phage integrase SAM-like domain-containing protein n=1 Tax=Bacteroides sp. CAG:633 TaxID=1262744 RepID=UPI002584C24C
HVYRSTLHRILDFTGGQPLTFGEVTPLWLKAFQNYLLGRQLQWNSVSTYMRMLRAVYLRAVDAGMAVFRPRLFKGVYTGTRVTVKRALSENDLRKLNEPKPAVRECSLERTRMLFLLLFMLRGIPFVDIAYLRKCDLQDNVLMYRRRKTGSWLTVRVEPRAMSLIEQLKTPDESSPYLCSLHVEDGARAGHDDHHACVVGIADGGLEVVIVEAAVRCLAEEADGASVLERVLDVGIFGACHFQHQLVERVVVAASGRGGKPAQATLHLACHAHGFGLAAELFLLVFVLHAQQQLLTLQVEAGAVCLFFLFHECKGSHSLF